MLVSPSLLAADFGNLQAEMAWFNQSQADMLHLDLMDGVFVPNLSFGFPVVEALTKICTKPLDVHLMVVNPENYLARVAKLPGVCYFNFHYEATREPAILLERVRQLGLPTAITISPDTPTEVLHPLVPQLDMVLVMSVYPGFGGQKFIPATLDRVRQLRQMAKEADRQLLIEIDGGVNGQTGALLAEAGADILVAGSYVFGSDRPADVVTSLKQLG